MRQVARLAGVERRQEQDRAGLPAGDEVAGRFAREMEAGVEIDRMHLRPGLRAGGECVIGLAPWRRGAVDDMGHRSKRGTRIRKQRIARGGIGEVSDPRHRQFRVWRRLHGCRDGLPVHISEDGADAFAGQRLRDGPADAVSGASHQRSLARGIEWIAQQAHRVFLSASRQWLMRGTSSSDQLLMHVCNRTANLTTGLN